MPCTLRRSIPPSVTMIVSSDQAPPRHMKGLPYRCFLPDLTGFESFHCAGPGHRHHLSKPDPTGKRPLEGIRPHCSGLWVQGTATSPSSTANLLTILFKRLLYFTIFHALNQAAKKGHSQAVNSNNFDICILININHCHFKEEYVPFLYIIYFFKRQNILFPYLVN
jgi:hypothetical protein